MIRQHAFLFSHPLPTDLGARVAAACQAEGGTLLRWHVESATPEGVRVAASSVCGELPPLPTPSTFGPRHRTAAMSLVPTGIGCEIGGYAGDAAPATALLAACVDDLVTHPNAVNASNFIHLPDNVWYTDGACLDLFAEGSATLYRPRANRVGLVVEQAEPHVLDTIYNLVNVARAVYGIDVLEPVIADGPVGGRCVRSASGVYGGTVDHPDTLLRACEEAVRRGATALALTTAILDLPGDHYQAHFAGQHPNPVGGAEAVLSYLVSRTFQLPAAHAPIRNPVTAGVVDARSAGEVASASGLACVLQGLRRASHLHRDTAGNADSALTARDLLAVVAPASALGGPAVLAAYRRGVPIIAVRDNETVLDTTAEALGLQGVLEARTYAEAAGFMMALRAGLSPASVARPLGTFRPPGDTERAVGFCVPRTALS